MIILVVYFTSKINSNSNEFSLSSLTAKSTSDTVTVMKEIRKSFLLLLIIAGLLYCSLQKVPQSQASFDDDYQNFLKISDSYRSSYASYISTRSQYLQFGTLSSKNDALTALKNFLGSRNDVLISYLSLLKVRNVDVTYTPVLDEQTQFLQLTKSQFSALGTIDDGLTASKQIEERHIPLQILSRQITAAIVIDKIDNLKLRFVVLENAAANLVAALRAQSKDITILDRWLLDAKNKRLLAEDKIRQVRGEIHQLNASAVDDLSSSYNSIQFTVSEANQYLREGGSYLHELGEAIKYGNY